MSRLLRDVLQTEIPVCEVAFINKLWKPAETQVVVCCVAHSHTDSALATLVVVAVGLYIPSNTMSTRRTGKHRIYMNVGYDLTEEQLRQFFSQYGDVTDVYLPKHKSGRNKGFGFTTFDSDASLQAALQAEEYLIGGEVVRINRAGPRPESELQRESDVLEASSSGTNLKQLDGYSRQPQLFGKGPRLYVGGIPEEVSEERLKAHFSRWGNVVDLYFPGKKGQSRVNYCFVTYDNWRAAQRACNQSERNIDGLVSILSCCCCCSGLSLCLLLTAAVH